MQKRIFSFLLSLLLLSLFCMNAFAAEAQNEKDGNDTRPSYQLGTCHALEDDIFFVTLFLDDAESRWDVDSMENYWRDTIYPGLDYLEKEAARYHIQLDFETAGYSTGMSEGITVRYPGVVGKDATEGDYSKDVLEKAVASLGFPSVDVFHERMLEFSGKDQVVILVAVNKPGQNYAMPDQTADEHQFIEYAILFSHYLDVDTRTLPSSAAHEVLHLFGAEDYYDPYGTLPARKQLADRIYPHDIMNHIYYDISANAIGSFTAYSVGWLHTLPSECDCPQWWS